MGTAETDNPPAPAGNVVGWYMGVRGTHQYAKWYKTTWPTDGLSGKGWGRGSWTQGPELSLINTQCRVNKHQKRHISLLTFAQEHRWFPAGGSLENLSLFLFP